MFLHDSLSLIFGIIFSYAIPGETSHKIEHAAANARARAPLKFGFFKMSIISSFS